MIPENSLLTRSLTPSSSLRSSLRPGDYEEDEDPFDPFSPKPDPPSFTAVTVTDFDTQWSNSDNSTSSISPEESRFTENGHFPDDYDSQTPESTPEMEAEAAAMLTDGMTPFDVLSSVFGSTLAPSELEDALANNAYDFERAMAWLVDRALPPAPQGPPVRMQQMGGRVTLVSNHPGGRGGRTGFPNAVAPAAPKFNNGKAAPGGNRVCRYFVAGECLRADCRFRCVIFFIYIYSSA